MHCTALDDYLVERFGQRFRDMRSQPPPGEQRERQGPVQLDKNLAKHICALGRESTLHQFIYWLANIFRRWAKRGGTADAEYRRGLAHMVLLCFPGAGIATSSL